MNISKEVQMAAIITTGILVLMGLAFYFDANIAREKEFTNRMAITNGASLNRRDER